MKEKTITQEEFNEILKKHMLWLKDNSKGKQADLSGVDLSNVKWKYPISLKQANLRESRINNAFLLGSNLEGINLEGATILNSDLSASNLKRANLEGAVIYNSSFYGVELNGANLKNVSFGAPYFCPLNFVSTKANFSNADFRGSFLENVDFTDVVLEGAIFDEKEKYRQGVILEKNIKGYINISDDIKISLEIPKGAIVFGIDGKRLRTNKAKVLEIIGSEKKKIYEKTNLIKEDNLVFEVGKTINIKNFSLIYNEEDGKGLYFYLEKDCDL